MSGRKEDKHENRTEHNPHISGAAGIPQGADSARAEEEELCTNSGAGTGLRRGRIYGWDSVHRSYFAVLPTGRADLRGGENGEKERVRCDYERRTSGKT